MTRRRLTQDVSRRAGVVQQTTQPAEHARELGRQRLLLGVALEPTLASLGKAIGPPWQKNYREATAAALVALAALD